MSSKAKNTTSHSQRVSQFDELPDSAFVPISIVCAIQGCSPATAWRLVRNGKLPQPKKFGARMTRFNVGALRAMIGGE